MACPAGSFGSAREQACGFGAEILIGREGVRGEFLPGKGVGCLAGGATIFARATICAALRSRFSALRGVDYRRLDLSNEKRFMGAGLYYGAGASEAAVCAKDDDVYIAGGGNSAGRAALFFSRAARSVTLIVLAQA